VRNPEPLIRFYLVRTAPNNHFLFVVAHHLALDGWSLGVIFQEIGYFFHIIFEQHRTLPKSLTLPPGAPYSKLVEWQHENMRNDSPVRQKLVKYPSIFTYLRFFVFIFLFF
jgi:Condensation domain